MVLSLVKANAQVVDIFFDNVPAVRESVHHRFYVSIVPKVNSSSVWEASISFNDDLLSNVRWNGKIIENNEKISVADWHQSQQLSFVTKSNVSEEWEVILTPNVVVDLQLDKLDDLHKDNPSKGTIKLADARKQTEENPAFESKVSAYYRGATARTFPKKSFTIELLGDENEEKEVSILNIRPDNKWILDAMAVDVSRMRNRLCFDLWNEIGELGNPHMQRNGTKGQYVEVVLNGSYNGMYCLSDKVNRKLLGLKKAASKNVPQARGRLYKCTTADTPAHFLQWPDKEYATNGLKWTDWELKYPNENIYSDTYQPLIDLIHFTDLVKENPQYVDEHLYDYFYKDNVVTFPVFAFALFLADNMMHNSYLSFYNALEDCRVWITPWDMDCSFGRDGLGVAYDRVVEDWLILQQTEPYATLFKDKESRMFKDMCDKWKSLREGALSKENVISHIERYAHWFEYSGAWKRECERWNGELTKIDETPEGESQYMKDWYVRNFEHLNTMFSTENSGLNDVIVSTQNQESNPVYLLSGRKVHVDLTSPSCPKGIYIQNGHKVIR